jgi:hypothetical protein
MAETRVLKSPRSGVVCPLVRGRYRLTLRDFELVAARTDLDDECVAVTFD